MSQSTPINQLPRGRNLQTDMPAVIPENNNMSLSQQMPPQTQQMPPQMQQQMSPQMQQQMLPQMQQQMSPQMQQQMPPQMQQQMPPQMQQPMPPQMPEQSPQQIVNEDDLVNDILNDIDTVDNAKDNINFGTSDYIMSDSQIPSETLNDNFLYPNNDTEQINSMKGGNDEPIVKTGNKYIDLAIKYLKDPIIIIILFVLLSLPQVNKMLFHLVPKLLNENGTISFYGILLKGVLCAILFVAINYFV